MNSVIRAIQLENLNGKTITRTIVPITAILSSISGVLDLRGLGWQHHRG